MADYRDNRQRMDELSKPRCMSPALYRAMKATFPVLDGLPGPSLSPISNVVVGATIINGQTAIVNTCGGQQREDRVYWLTPGAPTMTSSGLAAAAPLRLGLLDQRLRHIRDLQLLDRRRFRQTRVRAVVV
jgi:hypothetical protein